jgi:large subunit ribosomal protein L6
MSRVGKIPVTIPAKVSVSIGPDQSVQVEGPKGKLSLSLPTGVMAKVEEGTVVVERRSDARKDRAMHGTVRALVGNMVKGVSEGFKKNLEIHGVGFRAAVKGAALDLNVGKSHPVLHPIPQGLTVTVTDNTKIAVEGIDKHMVGQFAADVRSYYPPEPYKGKGIRYVGEKILRKEGKSVGK